MVSQNHFLGVFLYHSWTGARVFTFPLLKLRIQLDTVLPAGALFPHTAHKLLSVSDGLTPSFHRKNVIRVCLC